ncbi:MAG: tetratricopeptide repeat protein [Reyranellaceae bacterium]
MRLPILLALAAALLLGAPARATQADPQLEQLFARLQATRDPGEGEALQNAIWIAWTATDDKEAARMMAIGIIAMGQDRLDDALSTFDALVEAAPDFAEAWNKRATVHYLMGHLDESVADIEQTLALEPRHFGALSGLGLIYQQVEQWDAARRAFEAALQINPHMPTVRANIEALKRKSRDSTR